MEVTEQIKEYSTTILTKIGLLFSRNVRNMAVRRLIGGSDGATRLLPYLLPILTKNKLKCFEKNNLRNFSHFFPHSLVNVYFFRILKCLEIPLRGEPTKREEVIDDAFYRSILKYVAEIVDCWKLEDES